MPKHAEILRFLRSNYYAQTKSTADRIRTFMEESKLMLQVDGKDYLYLIWKSEHSRTQYIVGQLVKSGQYEFRYAKEVQAALNDGFTPLLCFPDVQKVYTDRKLFPVFASRLPDKRRKDIQDILKKYDLEQYDEYLLLKRSGARLPIDNFEFIDPIMNLDENVERKFFIAGVRHYLGCDGENCEKSLTVTRGDEVILKREPGNQYDENAREQ